MSVVDLVFSPFVFIVEQLFLLGYRLTGNYGVAVVLLSFAISLLLLPVFILIERAKKRDDAVKRKMKPVLDEIKRCYKGQERYYYIRTLHRQHGYNSFRALVPVLSLLLQIPFFIAAYQFLEHYEPLVGQGFLLIDDLSAPDRLLGKVNLLPILMTIVNLVTAWFYTRNGDTGERRQMLVVAGVFLVLLYNFPSGLVLYWTMNNVFSFFRLFITNPEVFRRKGWESGAVKIGMLRKKGWVMLRTGLVKIRIQPWIFLSLLFLSLYFLVSGKYYYAEQNNTLLAFSLVFMVLIQAIGFLFFCRVREMRYRTLYRVSALLLLATFLVQVVQVFVLLRGTDLSAILFNIRIVVGESQLPDIILPGLLFSVVTLPWYFRQQGVQFSGPAIPSPVIFLLSAAYIFGFIVLWNPLIVYASFPETFSFSGLDLMLKNLPVFVVLFLGSAGIYFVTPRKFRWLLVAAAFTTVAVSFIHHALLPIDVGTLQESRFEKERALIVSPLFYVLEGGAIIALFMTSLLLLRRRFGRQVIVGLALLNAVIIGQSLYRVVSSDSFTRNEARFRDSAHSIPFSKTEKNVIYFIPDMFQGWAMHRMMNENPELKAQLDGFVWYPNALAISRVTNTSVGPLLGGHAYAPDSLDQDTERTIQEKLSQAKRDLSGKIRQQGYLFSSTRVPYCSIEEGAYDVFLPDWHEDWDAYNKQLGIRVTEEINYRLLSYNALFFSAPLALKSKIYNNGQWLFMRMKKAGRNTSTSLKHQFLRLLPYISKAGSEKGNFVLIYSMVSHFPWSIVGSNGAMVHDVSPYENNKWILETLSTWFGWMKENGVYDNTRIVIVSDHGTHWKRFNRELDIDNPFKNFDDASVPLNYMLDLNPVILVKDFNASEPFSEDWRFMSNMDAIGMALGEDGSAGGIGSAPAGSSSGAAGEAGGGGGSVGAVGAGSEAAGSVTAGDGGGVAAGGADGGEASRSLPAFVSWWTRDMNNRTQFSLEHKYIVKDTIFNADNWTMVWDKHLGEIVPE
ncbi:MAG: membrane protein insertase YidC [Bacteroidales bacterium]|nr:membrane protein insertase YidC [Bacteroidales bacterium]